MPPPGAPAAAGAQAQQEGGMSPMIKSAIQGLAIFFGIQFFMNQVMGNKKPAAVTTTDASGAVVNVPANTAEIPPFYARPDHLDEGAVYSPIPQRIAPMWPLNTPLDITIVVSPTFVSEPLAKTPKDRIIVDELGFIYGSYDENRVIDKKFSVPKEVQNNGTLWAHFYIGISGSKLDPFTPGFDPTRAYHFIHPLTQYLAQKKIKKTKNLLAAQETDEPEEIPAGPIIKSHYHPNFTMSFIPDTGVMHFPTLQPASRQYVHLESSNARDGTGLNGWYYPVLFVNTFWQLRTHMMPVNSTVTTLPIHINLNHLANWKFGLVANIDAGVKETARNAANGQLPPGGGDGTEFEMIKEVLLDTNVYLLGTTVVVSILHMIFEMLAFKSDISHYRNKKNNVGISVRSILANVFMQGVIFLYLMDNNENTSWMILFSQGMGILLEFWKITTVVNVRIRPTEPGAFLPYWIFFEDKHVLSETEEKTKEYDAVAFKYLYMVAVPLLLAYAAYSVKYETHKSWYSFVITTLVGSVYAYGFLMMVPSLYINYRLKSVAHMPARAMTYKFLNTFIDDLFAFTIKMPTLHRLATLRDDVIFFVYLYQSYKYKVDYTRVNEFGQGGDDEEVEEKVANKPLAAPAGGDASIKTGKGGAEKGGAEKAEKAVDDATAKVTGSSKKSGATKRK